MERNCAFREGVRRQASAAGVNGKLYVFGGFQDTVNNKSESINDAYVYDRLTILGQNYKLVHQRGNGGNKCGCR